MGLNKFKFTETINPYVAGKTSRLGSGTKTAAGHFDGDKEVGKFVKFAAASRYDLAAAGDPIEGVVQSMEGATMDDYSIGTVSLPLPGDRIAVTLDGLQATPGTGAIAIGDQVCVGTVVAKGTALSAAPKVCKSTIQLGTTETAAASDVNDHIARLIKGVWVLVEATGTAVGSTGVIQKVL
jgi:hypothetical protein